MERLVKADVNKLVVVDNDEKVVGIVTVSDIIHFLVLRHCPVATRVRRGNTLDGRENSIGEEDEGGVGEEDEGGLDEEDEEEEDQEVMSNGKGVDLLRGVDEKGVDILKRAPPHNISKSCSPPRWFNT